MRNKTTVQTIHSTPFTHRFGYIVTPSDPIAINRGPRTSVTTKTGMWQEYVAYLDGIASGEITIGPSELGFSIDFTDQEVLAEINNKAKQYKMRPLKNPKNTFMLRLRKHLKAMQSKSPNLKNIHVRVREQEVALVGTEPF